MRLWELEEGDEGQGNVRFEGARGWEAAIIAAEEAEHAGAQAGAPAEAVEVPPPAPEVPDNDVVEEGLRAGMRNLAMRDVPPAPVGRRRARPAGPPDVNGNGVQRFVQMAMNDEEDGWDSDELDEDDEAWEIPMR